MEAEASLGALIGSLQNTTMRTEESLARSIQGAVDAHVEGDLAMSTQVQQLSSRLTQANSSLGQGLRSLASANANVEAALEESIQSTSAQARQIESTLSTSVRSLDEAAATRINLVSARERERERACVPGCGEMRMLSWFSVPLV